MIYVCLILVVSIICLIYPMRVCMYGILYLHIPITMIMCTLYIICMHMHMCMYTMIFLHLIYFIMSKSYPSS